MNARDEYDKTWANYKSKGPVSPVGTHHGCNKHWPGFEALCERAQEKGFHVEVTVSDKLIAEGKIEQRRDFRYLRVRDGDKVLASQG